MMTKEELDLIVSLALILHRIAPPDDQRLIERGMEALEAAAQKAFAEMRK